MVAIVLDSVRHHGCRILLAFILFLKSKSAEIEQAHQGLCAWGGRGGRALIRPKEILDNGMEQDTRLRHADHGRLEL